ncbi:DUF2206 domain-containing protein [Methanonatronarchaeum sp. AMET-Sl]|uniref:DUF2206 domain-containing protein n=1 Tax=Methanonatronarchaeum sp. AMET-Sl TaxID=3037654 RepID=UPI00244E135C|nr:DUF2206 domain-containing protein [Methanonatronarchaeum sp. AMET-Sl]WGI17654.1 DUF2206 domain-containing protein [Methanonatronarchaeum sp. AMET-Sl]
MLDRKELFLYFGLVLGSAGYIYFELPFREWVVLPVFLFLPGFLILKIFDLDSLRNWGVFSFSLAFSIGFLMVSGFILNNTLLYLGVKNPLNYLYLGVSAILLIFSILAVHFGRNSGFVLDGSIFSLNHLEIFIVSLSVFIFALSVFSANFMRAYDVVFYSFITYLSIAVGLVAIWIVKDKINEGMYPLAILSFSLSITILLVFKSSYFYGHDVYSSYYLANSISYAGYWSILYDGGLTSSLSITLLPPVLESFSGLDMLLVFNLLITLVLGLIPVILYLVLRSFISPFWSFIGAFFYLANMWYVTAGSGLRTQMAFLFVALLIYLLSGSIKVHWKKYLLSVSALVFIIFSHYATTYAFIFILFFGYLWTVFNKNSGVLFKKMEISDISLPYNTLTSLLLTLLGFTFIWNSYISAPFESAVRVIERSLLGFFYGIEEEHTYRDTLTGHGAEAHLLEYPLTVQIEFVLQWLIIIFIAVGAIYILLKNLYPKRNLLKTPKDLELNQYFDSEYFALAVGGFFVGAILLMPGPDPGMGISRTWGLLSLFFPILFIIGANLLLKKTRKKQLTIIILLAIFFLSLTGCTYYAYDKIGEEHRDIEDFKGSVLNNIDEVRGMHYEIYDSEIHSGKWTSENIDDLKNVYTDHRGLERVIATFYDSGYVYDWDKSWTWFYDYSFEDFEEIDGYIYLRHVNVEQNEYRVGGFFDYADFEPIYLNMHNASEFNKIYSNNGSQLFKK